MQFASQPTRAPHQPPSRPTRVQGDKRREIGQGASDRCSCANLAMARYGSSRLAVAKTLGQALANAPAHIGITTLSLHGTTCASRLRAKVKKSPDGGADQ